MTLRMDPSWRRPIWASPRSNSNSLPTMSRCTRRRRPQGAGFSSRSVPQGCRGPSALADTHQFMGTCLRMAGRLDEAHGAASRASRSGRVWSASTRRSRATARRSVATCSTWAWSQRSTAGGSMRSPPSTGPARSSRGCTAWPQTLGRPAKPGRSQLLHRRGAPPHRSTRRGAYRRPHQPPHAGRAGQSSGPI